MMHLTDGSQVEATVQIPDLIAMLVLKARVGSVRTETRDAEDLWRCIELVNLEFGIDVAAEDPDLVVVLPILRAELGSGGASPPRNHSGCGRGGSPTPTHAAFWPFSQRSGRNPRRKQ